MKMAMMMMSLWNKLLQRNLSKPKDHAHTAMKTMMNQLKLLQLKNSSKYKDHAHTVTQMMMMKMILQRLLNPKSYLKAKLLAHIAMMMIMMILTILLRNLHQILHKPKEPTTLRAHLSLTLLKQPRIKPSLDPLLPPLVKSNALPHQPLTIPVLQMATWMVHCFGMTLLRRKMLLRPMLTNKLDYNDY